MRKRISLMAAALAATLIAGLPAAGTATAAPRVTETANPVLTKAQQAALDLLDNLTAEGSQPGCYTKAARAAFRTAIDTCTSLATLNAAKKQYQASVILPTVSDAGHEYWYHIVSGPSTSYCQGAFVYDNTAKAGEQLTWNDALRDERNLWKFVVANKAKGTVRIVNKATGRQMSNSGSLGAKVTSAVSGTAFSLVTLGQQRGFLIREDSKNPVHADKNGTVVAWRTLDLGSASVWHFNAVGPEELEHIGQTPEYETVWSDEFDTDGPIDSRYWSFEKGFVRNFSVEPQWYQEDNAVVKDGNLVITARKERVKNPNYDPAAKSAPNNREYAEYTSSSVITYGKKDLLYGRIEVRAKIPTTSGAWPAIWCKGYPSTNGAWPACGEIDILEFYAKAIHANLAWSDGKGGSSWRSVAKPFTGFTGRDKDWSDKYHTWRMDWDTLSVRLYLDDELLNVTSIERTVQPVGKYAKVANPFKMPQFLLLNLAVRSADGIDESAFPLHYYIDYVRFQKPKSVPTAITHALLPAGQPWVVRGDNGYYVDCRAINGAGTLHIADAAGRLIDTVVVRASEGVYALPQLPAGIYVVSLTDPAGTRSSKLSY